MPTTSRTVSVSWLGQIIRLLFSGLLLTMLAWFIWLSLAVVYLYFDGWLVTVQWLQHLLAAVHAQLEVDFVSALNLNGIVNFLQKVSKVNVQSVLVVINQAAQLISLTFQLVFFRSWLFIQGSLIIVALNLLGLIDGLVQRDIRKFQGARESTFIFHRSKSLYRFCLLTGYFGFLIVPWAFSPKAFLLLLAILLAMLLQHACAYFKKYL